MRVPGWIHSRCCSRRPSSRGSPDRFSCDLRPRHCCSSLVRFELHFLEMPVILHSVS